MKMRCSKLLLAILGIVPIAFTTSILTFYFHAYFILGKFPKYNQPDPKELAIYNIYEKLISMSGNIWVISIQFYLTSMALFTILNRKKLNWKFLILSTLPTLLGVLLLFSEITIWFFD